MKNRNSKERKNAPVFSGVLEYFPDALMAVAELSKIGNDKHNPGEELNWSRDKSTDHGDCLVRHQLEYNKTDEDTGLPHAVSVAWRALAQLQTLLEDAQEEEVVTRSEVKDTGVYYTNLPETEQIARSKYALGTTCYRNTPYFEK